MFNNTYSSPYGNQYYPSYMPNYNNYSNIQMQQRPMQQPAQQPMQMQPQEMPVPFNDIKFVTADEAKAYIVLPNTKVMLMDRDKSVFYIKSADSLGKSTIEGFKYSPIDEKSGETVSSQQTPLKSITEHDLKNFATHDELKGFITRDDTKFFVTKDDLKGIEIKLDQLQKQINIKNILKGENENGK